MIRISDHKPLVLVTGCSGLIGTRLATAPGIRDRYHVVGLDVIPPPRKPDYDWHPRGDFYARE